jgi:putative nucleotidyltransferase with HDIG domain
MNLDALFRQPKALPTIAKIMQELIASFNTEDVAVARLVALISSDQVLSANVLRMANSAYFEVPYTVATVGDAVAKLGFTNVRTLVISIGLTGSFKSIPGIDAQQFWRHSLHTAVAARHLSTQVAIPPDLAFTVGLMHAIGELVMHLGMPQEMAPMDAALGLLDPNRLAAEQATFGYTHADVGAELARRWKFPVPFSKAIAGAANPLALPDFDPLAALVHIAAWRSRAEENQLSPQQREAAWSSDVAAKIALPRDAVLQDLPSLEELSQGFESLFTP